MRGFAVAVIALSMIAQPGCSTPPFVEVAIVDGDAERVNELNSARLDATFVLRVTSPPGAEPTDVLLLGLEGLYRYPNPCGAKHVSLNVTSEERFPLHVAPGSERNALITVGAPDPVIADCRVPEMLELLGRYYDSVRDEYLHEDSTNVDGEIALELDPNLSGPSDYSCIGKVPEPPYGDGNSKGFVWLRAYESGDVIPGVAVKSCEIADASCENPVDQGTTDIVGAWPLAVPNFSPYFYDVGVVNGFVPTLFFEYFPPLASGFEHILTPVLDSELDVILAGLGTSPEAGHGHVAVRILDCRGDAAVGLKVTAANGSPSIGYWDEGELAPVAESTTTDGFAFMANVPVGTATVEARLAISDDFIGSRVLHIRDGAISLIVIDPTPTR